MGSRACVYCRRFEAYRFALPLPSPLYEQLVANPEKTGNSRLMPLRHYRKVYSLRVDVYCT